jgi:hypothetical protein
LCKEIKKFGHDSQSQSLVSNLGPTEDEREGLGTQPRYSEHIHNIGYTERELLLCLIKGQPIKVSENAVKRWKCVVKFKIRPLYSWGRDPSTHCTGAYVSSRNGLDSMENQNIS